MDLFRTVDIAIDGKEICIEELAIQRNDYGFRLPVRPICGNEVFTIPSDASAEVIWLKGDKKQVHNDVEVDRTANLLYVTVTHQMTNAAGKIQFNIRLTGNGWQKATGVISGRIVENPHDDTSIDSTDEFGILEAALNRVQGELAKIEAASKEAETVLVNANKAIADTNAAKDKADTATAGANTARDQANAARDAANQAAATASSKAIAAEAAATEADAAAAAANTARDAANKAREAADKAAADANSKAAVAQAAAGLATTAAESVNTAKEDATTAAAEARAATVAAEEAKEAADTATAAANTARDGANTAKVAADAAANNANSKATAAEAAKTAADTATAAASAARDAANTAATNANNKATLAQTAADSVGDAKAAAEAATELANETVAAIELKLSNGDFKGDKGEPGGINTTFSGASSTFTNIVSGEDQAAWWGKLARWYTEIDSKINKSSIVNNYMSTDTAQVVAAPLAKDLNERVTALNDNLNGYKYYKQLKDFGLTEDTTINQIILAMGYPAMLNIAVWKPSYTIFPTEASIKGHLQIINPGYQNRYAKVIYEDVVFGTQWIMKMTNDDNDPASGEWEQQASKSDLANYLPLTGGSLTGTLQIDGGTTAQGMRIIRTISDVEYQLREVIGAGKNGMLELWEAGVNSAALSFDKTGAYHKVGNTTNRLVTNADLASAPVTITETNPNIVSIYGGVRARKNATMVLGTITLKFNSTCLKNSLIKIGTITPKPLTTINSVMEIDDGNTVVLAICKLQIQDNGGIYIASPEDIAGGRYGSGCIAYFYG